MTVSFASYMGPNTDPILIEMVDGLRAAGLDASVVAPTDLAVDPPDVVWACGLLTAEVIAGGGALTVVAAPVFAGEQHPVYRSVLVTRNGHVGSDLDSLLGGRLAINEYLSWSGCHAVSRELASRGRASVGLNDLFAEVVVTGSHVNSIDAVASGAVELAAIDHTVWDHVCATDPNAVANLAVVDQTGDWPAPPFSVCTRLESSTASEVVNALFSLAVSGLERIEPVTLDRYRFMLA